MKLSAKLFGTVAVLAFLSFIPGSMAQTYTYEKNWSYNNNSYNEDYDFTHFDSSYYDSLPSLVDRVKDAVVEILAVQPNKDIVSSVKDTPEKSEDAPINKFLKKHGVNLPDLKKEKMALGSGFVIDSLGTIITNNHVIGDSNDITVTFSNGKKLKAKVIGKDSKIDIAVLKVESDSPLTFVNFGDSTNVKLGARVLAVGNPFGLGETFTTGIISAKNRFFPDNPYDNYLQTDATVNRGNSGGPLFDRNGDVIGMNTLIYSPSGASDGVAFSIPSEVLIPTIEKLIKYHKIDHGYLGVQIMSLDDKMKVGLHLNDTNGALVASVVKDSPAEKAGLELGDVIVTFNGTKITDTRSLQQNVGSSEIKKKIDMIIIRDGKEMTKSVELKAAPEEKKSEE